jgi:hypothetical protein
MHPFTNDCAESEPQAIKNRIYIEMFVSMLATDQEQNHTCSLK